MATKKVSGKRKAKGESFKLDPAIEAKLKAQGWESVGGGNAESIGEGDVIEGTFDGIEDTDFLRDDDTPARLCVIGHADGTQTRYWCPTILASRLEKVNKGDLVRIECGGKIRTGNGRMAWAFTVHRKAQ